MLFFRLLMGGKPQESREDKLQRLMQTHGDAVLRVCYLYLRDQALAQDAAQTAFLKAWQAMHTLRDPAHEKAWLMRIAANTCKSMLRSPEYRLYAQNPDPDTLPEAAAHDAERDDTVLQAVLSLPLAYREVTLLHYYQRLSTEDVAKMLRVPRSTVLTRLHRARKQLQDLLKGWYMDNE